MLYGDEGNDRIYGSDEGGEDPNFNDAIRFGDYIDGGPGNDQIWGLGGADDITGNSGNDIIDGGANSDRIYGGDGLDTIYGGMGNDLIYGEDRQRPHLRPARQSIHSPAMRATM